MEARQSEHSTPPPCNTAANIQIIKFSSLVLKLIIWTIIFLFLSAARVSAADINVGTGCTLAQAINEANGATSGTGSCTQGDDADPNAEPPATGADIINMPSTAGTLRLSATLPTITSVITINGNDWTISGDGDNDGDGDTRIFLLIFGKLTVNNMTLTKALADPDDDNGGAIRLYPGTLQLDNVVMSDNKADGHGGAVFVDGRSSATIVNSSFSNNATTNNADAGAIYNDGSLSIKGSAFNGNSAHGEGYGGAISTSSNSNSTRIANSTFYGNSARRGGAIYNNGRAFKLLHATIVNNTASSTSPANQGGGINNAASSAEIKNSILRGNTGGDCRKSVDLSVNSGNLIATGNCGTSNVNPLLPTTPTGSPAYFALPSNSPAVNAVTCLDGVTVDQAGTSRPQPAGGMCDIGAYELPVAAPTASFSATVDSGNVLRWNFDASGSSGQITSYAWTFGDGNSGTGQTTARTYSGGGSYTVTLTVTGPGGSDTATRTINVSWPAPTASFSATVDSGNVLRWNFDASGSSGQITSYAWTFGDGNSGTGQTTARTYSRGGSYTVTLTVTGPGGSDSAMQSISVSTPPAQPKASFTFSVTGYQVSFRSTSTGSNLSFSWDVDGDNAEDYSVQNPTHTYASSRATYTVTLTVSNTAGSDSASQQVSVPSVAPPRVRQPKDRPDDRQVSRAKKATPTPTLTPTLRPSTCLSLPPSIQVSNITQGTQCQQVGAAGIGKEDIIAAGFIDAVDVWGWVLPNTQVCFRAGSGSFRFLDAATAPRAVSSLPAFGLGDLICTTIDGAGTVVLIPGPPAPQPSSTPTAEQSSGLCLVTTTANVNFRAAPGGMITGTLPKSATLITLERRAGWFKVDYYGRKGWISARHVAPQGNCG